MTEQYDGFHEFRESWRKHFRQQHPERAEQLWGTEGTDE